MAVPVERSSLEAATVRPDDPRYADLAGRGSGRFAGKPDYVRLVCSTEHSINHPDVDVADPAWNTSGVPWHTLYYRENYPRLQQIKDRRDPLNIFHHALSIRPGRHR